MINIRLNKYVTKQSQKMEELQSSFITATKIKKCVIKLLTITLIHQNLFLNDSKNVSTFILPQQNMFLTDLILIWVGTVVNFTVGFSLITQDSVKACNWHFPACSNILLETFMPLLVSLTQSSLHILGKTQTGVFAISNSLSIPHKRKLS